MSGEPEVSVVIPVYNEEEFLSETIESVLDQSFQNFELIAVDDCSTDKSPEILEGYDKEYENIKIGYNEENQGWAETVNRGIRLSRGEYIALLDTADICHEKRLEKQIEYLRNNQDVSVVGSYHYWIDDDGEIVGRYKFPTDPESIREKIFGFASITVCPSLMIRREVLKEIGLFDTQIPKSADYDFFVRVIANGYNIANIPEYLLSVRKRKGRGTIERIKITFRTMAEIKSRYLSRFFNPKNILFTLATALVAYLPSPFLRSVIGRSIEDESIRDSLLKF